MNPSITIRYTLTKDVYWDATRHLTKKVSGVPLWTSYFIIWLFVTVLGGWMIPTQLIQASSVAERRIVAGLIGGLFIAITARHIRKAGSEVETQETTLIFSEMGVEKRTRHSESRFEWKSFLKFSESDKYYFLHHAGRVADTVPKDAFATAQEAASFRDLLTRQVRSATLDPHPLWGRTRILFLILLFITVMVLVWAKALFFTKAGERRSGTPPIESTEKTRIQNR